MGASICAPEERLKIDKHVDVDVDDDGRLISNIQDNHEEMMKPVLPSSTRSLDEYEDLKPTVIVGYTSKRHEYKIPFSNSRRLQERREARRLAEEAGETLPSSPPLSLRKKKPRSKSMPPKKVEKPVVKRKPPVPRLAKRKSGKKVNGTDGVSKSENDSVSNSNNNDETQKKKKKDDGEKKKARRPRSLSAPRSGHARKRSWSASGESLETARLDHDENADPLSLSPEELAKWKKAFLNKSLDVQYERLDDKAAATSPSGKLGGVKRSPVLKSAAASTKEPMELLKLVDHPPFTVNIVTSPPDSIARGILGVRTANYSVQGLSIELLFAEGEVAVWNRRNIGTDRVVRYGDRRVAVNNQSLRELSQADAYALIRSEEEKNDELTLDLVPYATITQMMNDDRQCSCGFERVPDHTAFRRSDPSPYLLSRVCNARRSFAAATPEVAIVGGKRVISVVRGTWFLESSEVPPPADALISHNKCQQLLYIMRNHCDDDRTAARIVALFLASSFSPQELTKVGVFFSGSNDDDDDVIQSQSSTIVVGLWDGDDRDSPFGVSVEQNWQTWPTYYRGVYAHDGYSRLVSSKLSSSNSNEQVCMDRSGHSMIFPDMITAIVCAIANVILREENVSSWYCDQCSLHEYFNYDCEVHPRHTHQCGTKVDNTKWEPRLKQVASVVSVLKSSGVEVPTCVQWFFEQPTRMLPDVVAAYNWMCHFVLCLGVPSRLSSEYDHPTVPKHSAVLQLNAMDSVFSRIHSYFAENTRVCMEFDGLPYVVESDVDKVVTLMGNNVGSLTKSTLMLLCGQVEDIRSARLGALIDEYKRRKRVLVHMCIKKRALTLCRALIQYEPSVLDEVDDEQLTPLMYVARENANMARADADLLSLMKVMLDYGADVTHKTEDGRTALVLASEGLFVNDGEAIKLLLEARADVNQLLPFVDSLELPARRFISQHPQTPPMLRAALLK